MTGSPVGSVHEPSPQGLSGSGRHGIRPNELGRLACSPWGMSRSTGGRQAADEVLGNYYAFAGPMASRVVEAAATSAKGIRSLVRSFDDAGCDEVVLVPCLGEADELEKIIDAGPM